MQKRKGTALTRIILLLLVVSFLPAISVPASAAWDGVTVAKTYAGGTGTRDDPYLISNGEELALLAREVNNNISHSGEYFMLSDDINLGGREWAPIGWYSDPSKEFMQLNPDNCFGGNFNGNYKKITGLYISKSTYSMGLFGRPTGREIKNLTVEGKIIVSGGNVKYVGAVAGNYTGRMTNCSAQITITADSKDARVGGLAGDIRGVIRGCSASGDITVARANYVGGLVGHFSNSTATDCFAHVNVKTTGAVGCAGGFAGSVSGDAERCYATGTVETAGTTSTGGFTGAGTGSTVSYCYASGDVRGVGGKIGGFAGISGIVEYSGALGTVTGGDGSTCGGFSGRAAGNRISDCYATGNVKGGSQSTCGGFTGETIEGSKVYNCYSVGNTMTGVNSLSGGFCGEHKTFYAYILNCYALGTAMGEAGTTKGGFVASNNDPLLENCFFDSVNGMGVGTDFTGNSARLGVTGLAHSSIKSSGLAELLNSTRESKYSLWLHKFGFNNDLPYLAENPPVNHGNIADAVKWRNKFEDLSEGAWYYGNVEYAVKNGFLVGTARDAFSPNQKITRAMLVTVLARLGWTGSGSQRDFADVPDYSYYISYANWAVNNDLIDGYTDSEFFPDREVTREELAYSLYKYALYAGFSPKPDADAVQYTDKDEIKTEYLEAVAAVKALGLMSGKGDNRFDPKGGTLRSEFAAVLERISKLLLN